MNIQYPSGLENFTGAQRVPGASRLATIPTFPGLMLKSVTSKAELAACGGVLLFDRSYDYYYGLAGASFRRWLATGVFPGTLGAEAESEAYRWKMVGMRTWTGRRVGGSATDIGTAQTEYRYEKLRIIPRKASPFEGSTTDTYYAIGIVCDADDGAFKASAAGTYPPRDHTATGSVGDPRSWTNGYLLTRRPVADLRKILQQHPEAVFGDLPNDLIGPRNEAIARYLRDHPTPQLIELAFVTRWDEKCEASFGVPYLSPTTEAGSVGEGEVSPYIVSDPAYTASSSMDSGVVTPINVRAVVPTEENPFGLIGWKVKSATGHRWMRDVATGHRYHLAAAGGAGLTVIDDGTTPLGAELVEGLFEVGVHGAELPDRQAIANAITAGQSGATTPAIPPSSLAAAGDPSGVLTAWHKSTLTGNVGIVSAAIKQLFASMEAEAS